MKLLSLSLLLFCCLFSQAGISSAYGNTNHDGSTESTPSNKQELQISDEVKELTWVGFLFLKDASRVVVRTNEPVKYQARWNNKTTLVLSLYNTQVLVSNHLRPLDTKFFDSPVTLISPKVIDDISPSTKIVISTRKKAPFQLKQQDNVIFVDFQH